MRKIINSTASSKIHRTGRTAATTPATNSYLATNGDMHLDIEQPN